MWKKLNSNATETCDDQIHIKKILLAVKTALSTATEITV